MKRIPFLFLAFAMVIVSAGFAQKKSTSLSSEILTSWMDLHSSLVRGAKGLPHVAFSRHFSYTAIAAYESIVASDPSYRSLSGQLLDLSDLPVPSRQKVIWQASLNAAYAALLRHFYQSFGTCNASIDSMEKVQKEKIIREGYNSTLINKSADYGKAIACRIVQWSQTDNAGNTKEYVPVISEGIWNPGTAKAAAPFWSENRPLTKELMPVYNLLPPVYSTDTSAAFYRMAKEVYTVTSNLSAENRATAIYWDDAPDGRYKTVFGHWTSILSGLIKKQHLSLMEAAAAYAKMTIALHEACILAWKGKYQYNVLRPVAYIQQHINKEWKPLIATPPHPEFPAAHATLSTAAAIALCSLFGDSCPVTDNCYTDIGMGQRTYASLQDVAREAGLSRLYGGIHYRYSIDQGALLGAATARQVDKTIHFH